MYRLPPRMARRWAVRRLALATFAASVPAAPLGAAAAMQAPARVPKSGPTLLAGGGQQAKLPLTLEFLELQEFGSAARPALPVAATGRLLYDLGNLLPAPGQRAELLRPDMQGQLWPWPLRLSVRRSASELTFLPMPAEAGALSGLSIDLQRGWLHLPNLPRVPALQSGRGYRWDFASQQLAGGQAIRGQLMLQRLPQGRTLLVYHYTQMQDGQLSSGNVLLSY